jgi:hypothetical protein
MRELTDQAQQTVYNLAQRYGTSPDAVRTLLHAVVAGSGTMAQFSHPDLGGSGQWMQGGMTMVGDMFNSGLQARVSGLCSELSNLIASQQVYAPLPAFTAAPYGQQQQSSGFGYSSNAFWPAELGSPSSSGGQNDSRYAYFPSMRRLAVQSGGEVRIYDTLDHQIGGVSQQQSGYGGSFTFSSQYGQFSVESLPLVSPPPPFAPPPPPPPPQPAVQTPYYNDSAAQAPQYNDGPAPNRDDIFSALDRLGNLRDRGILSEDEFLAKKRELLARL